MSTLLCCLPLSLQDQMITGRCDMLGRLVRGNWHGTDDKHGKAVLREATHWIATARTGDAEPLPACGHLGGGESIAKPTSRGRLLACSRK